MNLLRTAVDLTPLDVERRRDRLAGVIQWAVIAGLGALVAPLAFALLQATVALALSAVLAMSAVVLAPVLATRLANWKMAAILADARNNPMPTLERELLARQQALRNFGAQLRASLAQMDSFDAGCEDAARQFPDMASRWRARATKARALAESQKRSYARAHRSVDEFSTEVQRCRTEWKLVLAESAMNKALTVGLNDPLAQLRAHTAIDSVTDRMNEAFAGLELELLKQYPAVEQVVAGASPIPVARLGDNHEL